MCIREVLHIEIYKQKHKNTSTIKQTCKDAYKVWVIEALLW